MATYIPGAMGSFTGKIGNIVITKWKKKLVGRGAPGKATKKPTDPQLLHRTKFSLISQLLSHNRAAINIGYQSANKKFTPVNAALKYHFKKVITGTAPNYHIDYSQFKLTLPYSKNEIGDGLKVSAILESTRIMKIRWLQSLYPNYLTMVDDLAHLVFYNPERNKSFFVRQGARRDALEITIQLPGRFSKQQIYGYLFFVSANGKLVSATHYLGEWLIE